MNEKFCGQQDNGVNYLHRECVSHWDCIWEWWPLGADPMMLLALRLKTGYITVIADLLTLQFYTNLPTEQFRHTEK